MTTKEIEELMSGTDVVKEQLVLIDFFKDERGLAREQAAVIMLLLLENMEKMEIMQSSE